MNKPVTMEAIRAFYPRPKNATKPYMAGELNVGYCVGGALCKYIGHTEANFPIVAVLADCLMEANPELDEHDAMSYALDIVTHNDNDDFDAAWEVLHRALSVKE